MKYKLHFKYYIYHLIGYKLILLTTDDAITTPDKSSMKIKG